MKEVSYTDNISEGEEEDEGKEENDGNDGDLHGKIEGDIEDDVEKGDDDEETYSQQPSENSSVSDKSEKIARPVKVKRRRH
jgi:hypothetical protein